MIVMIGACDNVVDRVLSIWYPMAKVSIVVYMLI